MKFEDYDLIHFFTDFTCDSINATCTTYYTRAAASAAFTGRSGLSIQFSFLRNPDLAAAGCEQPRCLPPSITLQKEKEKDF